jgi:very-short-patch-repair endonuclease
MTRRLGIPVTTPARTVSDLRRAIPLQELRRAVRQAELLGLPIGMDAVRDRTRSELEFLFLELCRRYKLPAPDVNVRVGSLVVDFVWHRKHLIVETDGYRYHRGRIAFEKDRSRDLELRALGYDVIRLTHDQVVSRPEEALTAVRYALSR